MPGSNSNRGLYPPCHYAAAVGRRSNGWADVLQKAKFEKAASGSHKGCTKNRCQKMKLAICGQWCREQRAATKRRWNIPDYRNPFAKLDDRKINFSPESRTQPNRLFICSELFGATRKASLIGRVFISTETLIAFSFSWVYWEQRRKSLILG